MKRETILPPPPDTSVMTSTNEPPDGWRAPSHRVDHIGAIGHVDGDYWCTCHACTSVRIDRVRLLSQWLLDDLEAAEATSCADNDVASQIETVRPPRAQKVA